MNKATQQLRQLLSKDEIYLAPGVYDGLSAKLAELAEFPLIYASGGAISRSMGVPDMGLISWTQIVERVQLIVDAVNVPVIADFDNGYGNALNAQYAIKKFIRTGVAAVHMEDQSFPKRCGHLAGKDIVSTSEFVNKIKAVKDVAGADCYLIARTDAIAIDGTEAAIERGHCYAEAGADMLFIEAPTTLEQIERIGKELPYPKLLNMFHSGKTPIVELATLKSWGYQLVIDPSDLQRAAITAMQRTLKVIKQAGHSASISNELASFKEREEIIRTDEYIQTAEKYK
ncbi:MAG: isocitrate lyase/PEP mutase family protein [Gammaproteobacteria bacterium]|nr:isocitrate lyase/PEP mutase family protein [Gammaproteobacteria bacterium]MCW5584485.1 isocitrate lyase/PEP mutase family protein [Gammaproteobacteria bacterium]